MKYIDAEKLKAEIERHIKEIKEAENRFHPNLGFFDAKLSGIYDVMNIIDSLQQEQPEVDIKKEIKDWCKENVTGVNPIYTADSLMCALLPKCACHFYELGRQAKPEIFDTVAFQKGVAEGRRLEKEDEK